MAKEFNKNYMHSTRKKLLDMVHTGEYKRDTFIGYDKVDEKREVGEVWEDEHSRYEQRDGFYIKTSKNTKVFDEIREYIRKSESCKNETCQTIKITEKDKAFIKRTGMCMNCTIDNEHKFRTAGLWKDYETYHLALRMIVDGKIKIEQLRQAHDEAKQVYEFINEDGTKESWTLPQDVQEVKADIVNMINEIEAELKNIEIKLNEAFERIKEHGYETYL